MLHTRKLWALMSLLVVVAMVFAACQPPQVAPAQPTPAPVQPTQPPPPPAKPTEPPPPPTAAPQPTEAPKPTLLSKSAPDCSYGGIMKSIEAVDENTVKFTLCVPDVAFLSKIAFNSLAIQSTAYLQKTKGGGPGSDLFTKPIGTGPYMVQEWVPGDHITLVANPNYWGDAPKSKTVIFKWNKEAAARLTSLKSGEVDGIDNADPNDVKSILADPTLKLYARPALNVLYLGFNNTKPPFDNEMVRQAIAQGIDRQAIVDKYYPAGSSVADYFTPCAIPGGCEGDPWYKFDPVAAKALLAKAGFPNGFKTTLSLRDVVRGYFPAPTKIAEEIQLQLKKNLGIDATIDVQESTTLLDNSSAGKLSMHLLGWGVDYPDQTDFLDAHFGKGASPQFGNKFDDLTAILAQAASTGDPVARLKLYAQANALVKQHVPMVPIAHGGNAVVFKATVDGALADPLANEPLNQMSIAGQDQLVFVQNAEPGSLYCGDETDGEDFRVCNLIFNSLMGYKPGDTSVVPGLATACTPNADLTEWTCTLRKGVKFSDGSALTANDVVETYVVQWDAADPLHVGRTGDFTYWGILFSAFLNAKK
jgi:peptide/nickel transport system substrate-binding protein